MDAAYESILWQERTLKSRDMVNPRYISIHRIHIPTKEKRSSVYNILCMNRTLVDFARIAVPDALGGGGQCLYMYSLTFCQVKLLLIRASPSSSHQWCQRGSESVRYKVAYISKLSSHSSIYINLLWFL